jgi:hypothetical protein
MPLPDNNVIKAIVIARRKWRIVPGPFCLIRDYCGLKSINSVTNRAFNPIFAGLNEDII